MAELDPKLVRRVVPVVGQPAIPAALKPAALPKKIDTFGLMRKGLPSGPTGRPLAATAAARYAGSPTVVAGWNQLCNEVGRGEGTRPQVVGRLETLIREVVG